MYAGQPSNSPCHDLIAGQVNGGFKPAVSCGMYKCQLRVVSPHKLINLGIYDGNRHHGEIPMPTTFTLIFVTGGTLKVQA